MWVQHLSKHIWPYFSIINKYQIKLLHCEVYCYLYIFISLAILGHCKRAVRSFPTAAKIMLRRNYYAHNTDYYYKTPCLLGKYRIMKHASVKSLHLSAHDCVILVLPSSLLPMHLKNFICHWSPLRALIYNATPPLKCSRLKN